VPSYFACRWDHDSHEDPVLIYEELDAQRFETRKVEEFRDGRRIRSNTVASDVRTGLSTEPIPSLEEIADQAEFTVLPLSESEFEDVWVTAQDAQ
jgi:hypothetical protein